MGADRKLFPALLKGLSRFRAAADAWRGIRPQSRAAGERRFGTTGRLFNIYGTCKSRPPFGRRRGRCGNVIDFPAPFPRDGAHVGKGNAGPDVVGAGVPAPTERSEADCRIDRQGA